ncbi:MAG: hypothetical protein HY525_04815 [Betaproteobacteria bacterium]|nr:hypothetical protein [Betaproteobacteria bacterium]
MQSPGAPRQARGAPPCAQASESADQCSSFIKAEIEKFNRIVKQTGIRAE